MFPKKLIENECTQHFDCHSTPTIQSGLVIRWQRRSDNRYEISASRECVMVVGDTSHSMKSRESLEEYIRIMRRAYEVHLNLKANERCENPFADAGHVDACNQEVYKEGEHLCTMAGPKEMVEAWCQHVARKSKQRVDWHYVGGRAVILVVGDIFRAFEVACETELSLRSTLENRSGYIASFCNTVTRIRIYDDNSGGSLVLANGGHELFFNNPAPMGIERLEGKTIWGMNDLVRLHVNQRVIGKRVGVTGIEFLVGNIHEVLDRMG